MDGEARHLLPLLSLLVFLPVHTHFSFAADTLNPGEILTGNQSLSSNGGTFELGFFRTRDSPNYFLGIWYKRIPKRTVVWVANRETPLRDDSAEVRIGEDGNLLILNQAKDIVWSSNSSLTSANATVAELLDSGNLVLRERSNSSLVFWQSFDYPGDTWLPGGWLGYNKITGERQVLTSWRSYENPAMGPYTLELDPEGTDQYVLRRNLNRLYWTSGVWNPNGKFWRRVPEMQSSNFRSTLFMNNYNFDFVKTEKGKYFYYSVHNTSLITRFFIDVTGRVNLVAWFESSQQWFLIWAKPEEKCDVISLCGSFGLCTENGVISCSCIDGFQPKFSNDWNSSDWSGGCMRRTPLNCGNNSSSNGEKDVFRLMTSVRTPENLQTVSVQGTEECKSACLKDCSCSAFSVTNGCSVWKGDLFNLQQLGIGDSQGIDLYLRLAASEDRSSGNGSKKGAVIGMLVGSSVACLALLGAIIFLWCRSRRRNVAAVMAAEGSGYLIHFTYKDLQTITKNFSDRLGGGGFGSVFRGALANSSIVAVKKLERLGQGEKQFRMEVSTIGKIQHMNIAHLRGFCSEGKERLLVYDYMPNGSLDSHLFGENNSEVLAWQRRHQIALGTARGLAYLHEECRDCIIHCDIKPENVLLDADFCPKVTDFGLAKLLGRDFSRVLTTVRGTRGYLAPEWISGVAITTKADVYSYGMMLFEIISGRRNLEHSEDRKVDQFFPVWAAKTMTEGDVLSLVDCRLAGEADLNQVGRACRVACWCIQDEEDERPSMGQVVQMLEGLVEVSMPPVPRSLQKMALNLERPATPIATRESKLSDK